MNHKYIAEHFRSLAGRVKAIELNLLYGYGATSEDIEFIEDMDEYYCLHGSEISDFYKSTMDHVISLMKARGYMNY